MDPLKTEKPLICVTYTTKSILRIAPEKSGLVIHTPNTHIQQGGERVHLKQGDHEFKTILGYKVMLLSQKDRKVWLG